MTPAEELAQAADKLDALASVAVEGPWRAADGGADNGCMWIDTAEHHHAFSFHGFPVSGRYVAAMNPLVGKVLAEWLREQSSAAAVRDGHSAWALRIARLINGGAS